MRLPSGFKQAMYQSLEHGLVLKMLGSVKFMENEA